MKKKQDFKKSDKGKKIPGREKKKKQKLKSRGERKYSLLD